MIVHLLLIFLYAIGACMAFVLYLDSVDRHLEHSDVGKLTAWVVFWPISFWFIRRLK